MFAGFVVIHAALDDVRPSVEPETVNGVLPVDRNVVIERILLENNFNEVASLRGGLLAM